MWAKELRSVADWTWRKGNEGVTALIQQTPGAIGYIELIYALNNKIPFAQIQNKRAIG